MKKIILILLVLVILALIGGLAYLFMNLEEQKQMNRDMQELAELDKQEMEPADTCGSRGGRIAYA